LFISILQFAFSQELHFRRYGIKEGLVHSGTGSREVIIQDKEGFLWFSTHHGLSRFDGIEFKNFKYESDNPSSLGDNFTVGIVEADDGKIWIGTADHGMYIFDPTTESFTQLGEEFTDVCGHGMNTLNKDQEGNIWIGTRFDGFCKWVKKTGQFQHIKDLSDGHHFYQQKNGTIWLGEGGGLYKILPDEQLKHMPMPGVSENWRYRQVHDVGEVENKSFLLTTSFEGFWLFDLHEETFTDARQLFPLKNSNVPYSFYRDQNENIWIGGNGELWQWNPKNEATQIYLHDSRNSESIPSTTIHCITEDRAGSLWLITRDDGIAVAHDLEQPFEIIAPMPVSHIFP